MVAIFADPSTDVNYWARFLMQFFIILVIVRIMGWILGLIKQPSVIGEIIAGVIVGPSVLGNINFWSTHIFPASSWNYFTLVGYIGLILFMFSLGLELGKKELQPQWQRTYQQLTQGNLRKGRLISSQKQRGPLQTLRPDPKANPYSNSHLTSSLSNSRIAVRQTQPVPDSKVQWKYTLPIGISTIIVPYATGAAFSLYLYKINNRDGFTPPDKTAFILFTASSMSFTAFPVLASILKSTNLLSTPIGTLTISCAALDDIMGWCSLAIASAFAKGSGIVGLWVILIAIAYVIFMFTIVRWVVLAAHAFLVKRDDEMNRIFLIGIFLLLLASSFFCETLGIHSFFGAFIAGIICPKSGRFNSELLPKLELVTVELLLPLFFAASGMRTSLGSLNDKFYGGITVLILVIAVLAKFLPGCLVTKIVTRRPWRFSISVGILMNTRGLVELIALNIGLQLKILSPRLFTMLIIMALVTTFMTCPLLWLVYIRKNKSETLTNSTISSKEEVTINEKNPRNTTVATIQPRF